MTDVMTHRGPDDRGVWSDPAAGVYLGQRRLAIIDLSEEGRQPMISPSGRYVIAYNGEIYNFPEIRRDLEKLQVPFRGHSDTEVFLAAVEQWGLDEGLRRSVGMFAFALWDRQERQLVLARDRLGIKPLYYGVHGGALAFGSELKALTAASFFQKEMDPGVLPLYLRYNYIPEPYTIWRNTFKLEPGTYLRVHAERWSGAEIREGASGIEKKIYWSAREIALRGTREPLDVGEREAVDLLEAQLKTAVRDRMVADVPLGAFLSGGVDSSTVVALMQELSDRPVKTFSIGFSEEQFNEARYAAEVAKRLGTDHTELYQSPEETRAVIPLLPGMYDEPYSDYSNIPTYLVSRLAREKVTVSLSGDGGDELFGGYNRHILINRLWRRFKPVPVPLRRAAAAAVHALSPEGWDRLAAAAGRALPRSLRLVDPGYKLHKLAEVMGARNPVELYHGLISEWKNPHRPLVSRAAAASPILDDPVWEQLDDPGRAIMYLDLVNYLPGDILTKLDRASMAVSLESRVPILDHRVAELAWSLPQEYKIRDGAGKWVLRQVLYRRVPREMIERPKQGFTVPIGLWIRGPLREWAEELLDGRAMAEGGVFRPGVVRSLWREHLSGKRNHDGKLWPVLMFEAWRRSL
jgi:asparagine synthase (glutamine-hydrolysing)